MDQTKTPAAETLQAASAYDTIDNAIREAEKAAKDASDASDQVSMVVKLRFCLE